MEAPRAVVALVTAPAADAERLAEGIVERRLAACVNVVPAVRSLYRWHGELRRDDEALLIVKTTAERIASLREHLETAHPYEVFELLALEVSDGNPAYLEWLARA